MKMKDITEGISKSSKRELPYGTDLFRAFYRDISKILHDRDNELMRAGDRLNSFDAKLEAGKDIEMSTTELVDEMWDVWNTGSGVVSGVRQILAKYSKGLNQSSVR